MTTTSDHCLVVSLLVVCPACYLTNICTSYLDAHHTKLLTSLLLTVSCCCCWAFFRVKKQELPTHNPQTNYKYCGLVCRAPYARAWHTTINKCLIRKIFLTRAKRLGGFVAYQALYKSRWVMIRSLYFKHGCFLSYNTATIHAI